MQKSLLLFIVLLCTLTISVYFSNASLNVTEKMTEGLTTTPTPTLDAAELAAKKLGESTATTKPKSDKKLEYEQYPPFFPGQHPSFFPGQPPNTVSYPNQAQNANPVSDYYNWLSFWNTVANSNDPNAMFQSSNYIPKTSVIPPVCPNCPQCAGAGAGASTGVCNSCGGQGGSGTSSMYKNKFADFLALYGKGYKGDGKWDSGTSDSSGNNRGPGLGRLAEEAGSGAVDLTKTVLKDATGLARDTGSGAVGLLKDTGSGAAGFLKDTGSGVKDLLEDTGSGVAGLLKSNPTQLDNTPKSTDGGQGQGQGQSGSYGNSPYQSGYYSQGTYNLPSNPLGVKGIDPYSYNGALVSKGSNYIPITDDFSAFRK